MTESEWWACADNVPLYEAVAHLLSERKTRLYIAACARLTPLAARCEVLDTATEVVERAADGAAGEPEVAMVHARAHAECRECGAAGVLDTAPHFLALAAYRLTTWPVPAHPFHVPGLLAEAVGQPYPPRGPSTPVHRLHAAVLRDVVPDPYRGGRGRRLSRPRRSKLPADIIDPSWRSSIVLSLAQGVYDDAAFDRLPILADALMEAGCDDEIILTHCRGDGPHVRGCWVVDAVLGKT